MARKDYAKKRNSGTAASRMTRSNTRASAPVKKPFPLIRSVISVIILVGFGFTLWQLTTVKPDNSASDKTTPAANPPAAKESTKSAAKPVAKATTKPEPAAAKAVKPDAKAETRATVKSAIPVEEQSERFDFYQILPESEVDTANVEPYKSTPKDAKSEHTYVIQAGSFKSQPDAEQLRARLILEGLPNVKTNRVTNANGSIWYQVLCGPFDNRSMLSKAEDRLVRMRIQPLVRQID
ncbi:SPOR domain-containing protein [uncultured Amphritea sp.]|uniref:SPOR domain-containing protein n=1 Tax=uncultured Amphritea sp. TaxID=981605 RepID=UPI0026050E29|nr:SPOR domain-containing protein [uncultured Amphritea sp.]